MWVNEVYTPNDPDSMPIYNILNVIGYKPTANCIFILSGLEQGTSRRICAAINNTAMYLHINDDIIMHAQTQQTAQTVGMHQDQFPLV